MKKLIITCKTHKFEADLAATFLLRFKGLMLQHIKEDTALLILPCNEIHCLNMLSPIDVIYINKQGAISEITERMEPWTIGKKVKDAYMVLELAPGKSKEYEMKKGDMLMIQHRN